MITVTLAMSPCRRALSILAPSSVARRAAATVRAPEPAERRCQMCDRLFPLKRLDSLYCSPPGGLGLAQRLGDADD